MPNSQQSPLRNPAFRKRVEDLINADMRLKTIALELNVSNSVVTKWARALGFRRMFVTKTEADLLLSLRKLENN